MATPDFRIHLTDLRQLVPALEDVRRVGVFTDLRQLVPAFVEVGVPEEVQGAVLSVTGRVPMLTTTGRPPYHTPAAVPWEVGGYVASATVLEARPEVIEPEPYHYVPGPTRGPVDPVYDTVRVTDALGATRDISFMFRPDEHPSMGASLDVPVDTDGIWSCYVGGTVQLNLTGASVAAYWDVLDNRTGCTITPGGYYIAGPVTGWDRLRASDSNGNLLGYATVEVNPGEIEADFSAPAPVGSFWGFQTMPYARVRAVGGTAPYTVSLHRNDTGGGIAPPTLRRVRFTVLDAGGSALDLAGWSFSARLLSQRGGVLAADLEVTAAGNLVEVEIPTPAELALTPAVLRVEAETAGLTLSLGYPTVALEALLVAQES